MSNCALHVGDGLGELEGLRGGRLEDVKGEALGRAAADAGELGEVVDESLDGFRVGRRRAGTEPRASTTNGSRPLVVTAPRRAIRGGVIGLVRRSGHREILGETAVGTTIALGDVD